MTLTSPSLYRVQRGGKWGRDGIDRGTEALMRSKYRGQASVHLANGVTTHVLRLISVMTSCPNTP